jgi:G3E family GTPase
MGLNSHQNQTGEKMIKVDIISGFLGAGKTTLIKLLAKALNASGERIVIIENEFGEIGIDGRMLEIEGLEVYEITRGCLCCSVKWDFVETLQTIAREVRPDRILIEPSGIFVPVDVLDVFKIPEISQVMQINSLVNILDSLHYLKQRLKYRSFFENQIRYAEQVVMSKTETLSEETLAIIRSEISKIKPGLPVYTTGWNDFSAKDLLHLVTPEVRSVETMTNPISTRPASSLNPLAKEDSAIDSASASDIPPKLHKGNAFESASFKKISHPVKSHKDFSSFTLAPQKPFTKEALRQLLEGLSDENSGTVLRMKGFVRNADTGNLLEFNVVDQTIDINVLNENLDPTVYFIGEDLDKENLTALF